LQGLEFEVAAKERVIGYADGDARRLLNVLEQLQTAANAAGVGKIDTQFLDATLAQKMRRFDKGGEAFYDQISALHKSVRGSNPDAALYWLVRMLDGGADPRYLARRIVRMAWEDIAWPIRARSSVQRCGRDLRTSGFAGRRAGIGAGGAVSRRRGEVECRVRRV